MSAPGFDVDFGEGLPGSPLHDGAFNRAGSSALARSNLSSKK